MNFSDYQNLTSSEKVVLATLDASKRLMGWTLHSGSIYKIEDVSFAVIESIVDSGTAYTEAADIASTTASKYFLDRDTQTLYLRTTGSDNPNGRFIVGTFRLFLANLPIVLPYDLDSGFEVQWEPWITSNSQFGVEIDTINQTSESIEGSGSLTLLNDQDFWPTHFDKLIFENQECSIYSFNRSLAATEAQLIFRGKVEKRSYKPKSISFQLKDALAELRAPVALSYIEDLEERHSEDQALAFQRMILGRVFGFRPTNIDQVNSGYPITGTVAVTQGADTVTGTSTTFLAELSRDDKLVIAGVEYTVATVTSDTAATITENYAAANASGLTIQVIPEQPKRWINRVWKIAGHAICQPTTLTQSGSSSTRLYVESTASMFAGDKIYVGDLGSGELVTIERVMNSHLLKLSTSLLTPPLAGVTVIRPAIQNLRIDDLELRFDRDFSIDAENGELTLEDTAEYNASPIHQMTSDLTFVDASRTVTGTGLDVIFRPGYMVGQVGQVDMFEVMDVSETELILRTPSTFDGVDTGTYKSIIFNDDSVLSCDVLGRTDDGTSTGALLRSGPEIVRQLLVDIGLTDLIDEDSFDNAEAICDQDVGLVVPVGYSDTKQPTYRDVINSINRSILGSLCQTNAFYLSYLVIQPRKNSAGLKLKESDILDFSIDNNSQNMIKTAIVHYRPKEYDYTTLQESIRTEQKTSDSSTYILQTDKEKTFETNLVEEADARIMANRMAFVLENSSGLIKLRTKLQGATLEVGDTLDIEHRKLFVRFGSSIKRRIVMVEKITKDGSEVNIEAVDLSNAFARCANITSNDTPDFDTSDDTERLLSGYITDNYGMQDNESETFGTNLIW